MEYICTRQQMQDIDRISMEDIGIPASVLMERAALAVVEEVKARFAVGAKCLVLVGPGNNGGDGLALSRILSEQGYSVQILLVGDHRRSQECDRQLNILKQIWMLTGAALSQILMPEEAAVYKEKQYDVVIDSIFGIGLCKPLVSPEVDVIRMVNQMNVFRIAVDIPTGLDADTGKVFGTAFKADLTVTFGYSKLGIYMGEGPVYTGELVVADIGFLKAAERQVRPSLYTMGKEMLNNLPERVANSNKGTYGRVAVIAGSENIAGAAYFAAAAAYRSGVGLVKVYTHGNHREMLFTKLPEALYETYDGRDACEVIADAAEFADVLVVGPGLSQSEYAGRLVYEALQQSKCPVILDADGLNIVAAHKDWLKERNTQVVVTPHFKEMERLTDVEVGQIAYETLDVATRFAQEYGVICVLKGAHAIVTGEGARAYINRTGNHGMSTGGTGDVLTGVIAAMVAGRIKASCQEEHVLCESGQWEAGKPEWLYDAVCLGVFLHGMAGDKAAELRGERALVASDLLDALCQY
ncbi:MAG: NAD(P)H-hydrate dehydratase [Lachnospiraceae bacterium]|nr:NAD(P)H-hydrate dehydratase [Lachnospiraceae bacterium]